MHVSVRTLFIAVSLCFGISTTGAQTYFYIGSIAVTPPEPTTNDAITISLTGDLSSSGAYIASTSYTLSGNTVHITVNAADPGGLSVLVPHTEEVEIGTLPAGSYGILVDGDFILDSAPEFQHSFNVSGGPDCSVLSIESVQWATFSDTSIVVFVTSSEIGFSYPAFVLLDEQGDTLAVETPDLFAIGLESLHTLTIHPDAIIPSGTFDATLHLWTGFFSDLVCTWEVPVNLCPAQECVMVYPYIQNTGNGTALGTYTWTITDDGGDVAAGQFELTEEVQQDQGSACLSPGHYWVSVVQDQEPTGGQLWYGVFDERYMAGPSEYLAQVPPTLLQLDVLERCTGGPNGIPESGPSTHLLITNSMEGLAIRTTNGEKLGTVLMYDSRGALVETRTTTGDQLMLRPRCSGIYVIQAAGEVHRTAFMAQ